MVKTHVQVCSFFQTIVTCIKELGDIYAWVSFRSVDKHYPGNNSSFSMFGVVQSDFTGSMLLLIKRLGRLEDK